MSMEKDVVDIGQPGTNRKVAVSLRVDQNVMLAAYTHVRKNRLNFVDFIEHAILRELAANATESLVGHEG